jgi:polyisoprenoid-binding protein YceI
VSQWAAAATIDAASIDTNVEKRDAHLRSKDFFETDKYPTLTFKSTGARDLAGNTAKVDGILSLHGVEKPVTLDVEIHGEGADPWGNTRLGLTATTKINRKDFGLGWNEVLESGQLLVGEEIEIVLEIEGLKQ